ncbi:MAG: HAD family hydrolase [Nanoarchaeota archaeon]
MNRAIFLDRDGTINKDKGYVYKIKDLELYKGVIKGLALLKDYKLFIITNQSGINRGFFTIEDMEKFNNRLLRELSKNKIIIQKIYYCPHTKEDRCKCRKPNTKFIAIAAKKYKLNLKKSWVIGDHPFDLALAKRAGSKSVYLLTGHGKKHLNELKYKPEIIAGNILKAAREIVKNDTT